MGYCEEATGETMSKLELGQLDESMTILAYVDLEEKFPVLDEATCLWLGHNFPGTKVTVKADGGEAAKDSGTLKAGEVPLRISDFPANLSHLVHVTPRLVRELKKQGFSRFEVRQKTTEEVRLASVKEAASLVKKVAQGAETREAATTAVEDLMDNIAKGVTDLGQTKAMVDKIIENSYGNAMSAISSLKQSDQTYAHCVDVGVIFFSVYREIMRKKNKKSIFKDANEALLCAILHDVGKSKVKKEILESTKKYDRNGPEMQELQSHPTYSIDLIKGMGLPDYAVNMAAYHHVKVDSDNISSYPQGFKFSDAIYEARLLAVVDIYQALIGRRSYKKSWSAPAAIRFIEALAGIELDEQVWKDFLEVMGYYPVGSLVELEDGNMGFVLTLPKGDLKKPALAVVRDAQGNLLKEHRVVDLAADSTAKIVKEHDPYEIFGEEALNIFASLKPA